MGDVARSFWDMMSLLLHHSQAARPAEHWTALSFAGASACKALSPFHRAAPLICTFWCNTRQRTRACTAFMEQLCTYRVDGCTLNGALNADQPHGHHPSSSDSESVYHYYSL
eukprot:scaffold240510_cov19-Tisochrysis_lutea.AAC.3